MTYKRVLSYYFKNFFYILLFAILPALLIGLLLRPFGMIEMLFDYPNTSFTTFSDMFLAVYSYSWWQYLLILLALIVVIVCGSLLCGKIEVHFRTGKFDLSWHNSRGLNYNLLGITKTTFIIIILGFIVNLVSLLLMFLVHFVFQNTGMATLPSIIINWVLGVANVLLLARITTYFVLTGLDIVIIGSPLAVAMSNAGKAIAQKLVSTFFAETLPFVLVVLLTVLGAFLHITLLTNCLAVLFLFPYVIILGMINIFDYYDLKRYDNRKYYLR